MNVLLGLFMRSDSREYQRKEKEVRKPKEEKKEKKEEVPKEEEYDPMNGFADHESYEIEEGICLYTDGKTSFTMRPHLYRGVPCNGWMVDENGNILQQKGGGV